MTEPIKEKMPDPTAPDLPVAPQLLTSLIGQVSTHVMHYFMQMRESGLSIHRPHNVLQQALDELRPSASGFSDLTPIRTDAQSAADQRTVASGPRMLAYCSPTLSVPDHHQQLVPLEELKFPPKLRADPAIILVAGVEEGRAQPIEIVQRLKARVEEFTPDDIPVLIATRDPDFFWGGLNPPARFTTSTDSCGFSGSVFDPALWEEALSHGGFSVLEQRPMHQSAMPAAVWNAASQVHQEMHDGAFYVPARQGPWHWWLACRKSGKPTGGIIHLGGSQALTAPLEAYSATDTYIELPGNLLTRVHVVQDGAAEFRCEPAKNIQMPFQKGDFFGQLELSGNYISCRAFGELAPMGGLVSGVLPSLELRGSLQKSTDIGHKLFLSLLRHMDSIRFETFIDPGRVSDAESRVFPKLGLNVERVRNYAAVVLQKWANAVARQSAEECRSRSSFELQRTEILQRIYGSDNSGRGAVKDVYEIIPSFVRSGIIDCFSADCYERFQDVLGDQEYNDSSVFHVGWMAGQLLDHQFPIADDERRQARLYDLAIAISVLLGHRDDTDTFKGNYESRQKRPEGRAELIRHIISLLAESCDSEPSIGKVQAFLTSIHKELKFNSDENFRRTHELSNFVVVRDLWALLACLLDEPEMWLSKLGPKPPRRTVEGANKARLIAYFQEFVAYLGASSGLAASPWDRGRKD